MLYAMNDNVMITPANLPILPLRPNTRGTAAAAIITR